MRQPIWKTYKLYIGGKFPRTESGRYEPLRAASGALVANVSRASRKDFRNSVVAARAAFPGWAKSTAYLRGQILYRAAEMLEGRADQFAVELQSAGMGADEARADVERAVDLLVSYAGWTDKYQSLCGSVNPVASSHFCFSTPEPTGVVAVLAPPRAGLSGFVEAVAPVIAGGNSCVALAPIEAALAVISFSEVLATSDLPGGVVNVLTGHRSELLPHIAAHMDVNALVLWEATPEERQSAQQLGADNLKRCIFPKKIRPRKRLGAPDGISGNQNDLASNWGLILVKHWVGFTRKLSRSTEKFPVDKIVGLSRPLWRAWYNGISVRRNAMSANEEKIVSRWLPRLSDPSNDVKEAAAEKLADVARRNPAYRESIVPALLNLCRTSEYWPLVSNGILYPTSDIPKQDPHWVDAFLDVYIYLAKKGDYVTGESGYRYIWQLIEEGVIDETHKHFPDILSMAQDDKQSKEGDERKFIFSILDWYEDR